MARTDSSAQQLAQVAALLQRYYARDLTKVAPQDWAVLTELKPLGAPFDQALDAVMGASEADKLAFEYEFNRLFVGPGKTQAPPYETVYVNELDTLMRATTLAVRQAYAANGFQVSHRNTEPDDHAAFEMAFTAALLERVAKADAPAAVALDAFATDHLSRWLPAHVAAIRKHTSNEICLGFAALTLALLESLGEEESKHD